MMLNDLLLIILSASCAVLLFYYLHRLTKGQDARLSLLAPFQPITSPRKRGAEGIAHQPAVPEGFNTPERSQKEDDILPKAIALTKEHEA